MSGSSRGCRRGGEAEVVAAPTGSWWRLWSWELISPWPGRDRAVKRRSGEREPSELSSGALPNQW
eukprot:10711116-Heterocapsa_arctica.AAC.1